MNKNMPNTRLMDNPDLFFAELEHERRSSADRALVGAIVCFAIWAVLNAFSSVLTLVSSVQEQGVHEETTYSLVYP